MAGQDNDSGFTLIELLVVLAVFGLLSVILSAGFRFAEQAISRGSVVLAHTSDLMLTNNFFRAQLSDARPLPDPASAGITLFAGQPDSVAFIGAPSAYLAAAGFHLDRIGVVAHAGKRDLAFQSNLIGNSTGGSISTLIEGIDSVRFAYFGKTAANRAASWRDDWTGETDMPRMVRLRVRFADGTTAPDLVVAVRTAGIAFQ